MEAIQGTLYREPTAPAGTPPLVLFFETKPVKNERASRDGPPVFDTVDQVRVIIAGMREEGPIYELKRTFEDGSSKIDQAAYKRFGKPYEEWKTGQSPSTTGTPIEQWPLMDVAMVATLKAMHVYTVQQLADLSDSALDQTFRRGGREWRAKALAWIDEARTAAGDAEARATIARQQGEIDELRAMVKELAKKQNTPGYDKPTRKNRAPAEDVHVVEDDGDARL